jgi:choline dehydrogenase-like flavoprotein
MAAASMPLQARDTHAFMASFRHAAACLCLVPDRPVGTVTRDRNGRPRISYALTPEVEATLREAIRTGARAWLASGAERVVMPFAEGRVVRTETDLDQLDHLRIRSADTPLISAHPQGTCRMGPDTGETVVDPSLRVHGVPNLWVMDASVFPTTAATHTMLPVMAYAWLAAHEVAG